MACRLKEGEEKMSKTEENLKAAFAGESQANAAFKFSSVLLIFSSPFFSIFKITPLFQQ